jgi:hypothetical protein
MLRRFPASRRLPGAAVADASSIDLSREAAHAAIMDWMGRYVPAWGTSIVLHAAVVLLAAFMATQARPEPPVVRFAPIRLQPVKSAPAPARPRAATPKMAYGGRPTGTKDAPVQRQPVAPMSDKIPGLGRDPDAPYAGTIGTGNDKIGGEVGPWGPGDKPGGERLFPPGPEPASEEGRRIVYVVDRSGSMTDSLDFVKYELKRSLQELGETAEFHIVFFSSGPPMEMATRRLVAATPRNRSMAMEFIDTVIATGGTDPVQALERAFAAQPDVIYLLTDGEFDQAIVGHVKRLNVGGKVRVSTIGFLYYPNNRVLREIAAQNGGEYKFVSEADLPDIARR